MMPPPKCHGVCARFVAQGVFMSLDFVGPFGPPLHHRGQLGSFRSAYSAIVGALIAANAFSFIAVLAGCGGKAAGPAGPPPEVKVLAVVQRDVPIVSEWVATLDGYVNAQIQPQVTGYIIKQTYKEGSFVRKGQVLFEIDPRPFQAVLDQANAQVAQAQAQMGKT